MMHYILKISWIVCVFLFFQNNCGWGSGGSIISAGALGRYSGDETGYRQLVKLKVNGGYSQCNPTEQPNSIGYIARSWPERWSPDHTGARTF